jgi:hypothetical protein
MRRNAFGDTYFHTADELKAELGSAGHDIYCGQIDPPDGDDLACGSVMDNESGETVFYVEAATEDAVAVLLEEADIQINI